MPHRHGLSARGTRTVPAASFRQNSPTPSSSPQPRRHRTSPSPQRRTQVYLCSTVLGACSPCGPVSVFASVQAPGSLETSSGVCTRVSAYKSTKTRLFLHSMFTLVRLLGNIHGVMPLRVWGAEFFQRCTLVAYNCSTTCAVPVGCGMGWDCVNQCRLRLWTVHHRTNAGYRLAPTCASGLARGSAAPPRGPPPERSDLCRYARDTEAAHHHPTPDRVGVPHRDPATHPPIPCLRLSHPRKGVPSPHEPAGPQTMALTSRHQACSTELRPATRLRRALVCMHVLL